MASASEAVVRVRRLIHVIPVGGREPLHTATRCCPCHPLVGTGEDEGLVVHHAWDLREKWERQDFVVLGTAWVQVAELEVLP